MSTESSTSNPLESTLTGYVALSEATAFPSGIGIGMYSRDSPDSIRRYRPNSVVTNVERARQIAREYHDWDLPSEDEILEQRLRAL
jgi:hypothetical protein